MSQGARRIDESPASDGEDALATNLARASLRRQKVLTVVLVVGLAILAVTIVGLYSTGVLSTQNALIMLAAPVALVAVAFRPAWVVVLLVAVPPAFQGSVLRYRPLAFILLATLAAQLVIRGKVHLDHRSGLYPLFALMIAAMIFKADVSPFAAFAADSFFKQFSYYLLLGLVAYNATRSGDLEPRQLVTALLISVWATVILKVLLTGFGPVDSEMSGQALFYGRQFAYLAVIGFSVHYARSLSPAVSPRERAFRATSAALSIFLVVIIGLSLLRAAWLATLLVIIFVSAYKRRRVWWLAIPLALIVVLSVPAARERAIPSEDAPTDITTGRWSLWTNVWNDEVLPALPWGNGFGYAWTLTPERVFGFRTFLVEGVDSDRFLYLHNNFLFWLVEFGLMGLGLFIVYWVSVTRATVRLLRQGDPVVRGVTLALLGVLAAMLVAQTVGNGYAFRALAERFFAVSGFLFGLNALNQSLCGSPHRFDCAVSQDLAAP